MASSTRPFEPLLRRILEDVSGSGSVATLAPNDVDKWCGELRQQPRGEELAVQLVALAIRVARMGANHLSSQLTAVAMAALCSTGDQPQSEGHKQRQARELVRPTKVKLAATLDGVAMPRRRR
ncbi:MAG: hypothetical protein AAB426_08860 [Myxococcota bacterium]